MTLLLRSAIELSNGELTVFAPAKINLWLEITGRRDDGYHLLDSLFVFADCGDQLTFSAANALELNIDGPEAQTLSMEDFQDNLVFKAAKLLQNYSDTSFGASISLQKNLPVASGIGGGSADAAAALIGLNKLWSLGLGWQELAELALRLGADVPSALFGRALHVSGIGETLAPVELKQELGILLANPRIPISTPRVFREYGARSEGFTQSRQCPSIIDFGDISTRRNDLEQPAVALEPDVAICLSTLAGLPGASLARMSGSGATCFALFNSPNEAEDAAEALKVDQEGWWIWGGDLRA